MRFVRYVRCSLRQITLAFSYHYKHRFDIVFYIMALTFDLVALKSCHLCQQVKLRHNLSCCNVATDRFSNCYTFALFFKEIDLRVYGSSCRNQD